MSTIINGTSSAITFPDTTVQNTAFTTGAVTQSTIATGVAGTGPAFNCYCSTAQSITAGGANVISVDTKVFDTAGCFNNTGSTVTLNGLSVPSYSFCPNIAGYYQINGNVILSNSNTTGATQAYIIKNAAVYAYGAGGATDANASLSTVSMTIYLNGTGDYVRLGIFQSTGGTKNLLSGQSGFNNISGALVRAA